MRETVSEQDVAPRKGHRAWYRAAMNRFLPAIGGVTLLLTGCVDYDVVRKQDVEIFKQPVREGGVDILWVVDSSFSMDEEQVQLASHAATFITFLSTAPVDFKLGVTTTDVAAGGMLIGPLLATDTPSLTAAFVDQVTGIGEGDRTEVGFLTAVAAAESGQLRPGADLEIVFFTDEDDQSLSLIHI